MMPPAPAESLFATHAANSSVEAPSSGLSSKQKSPPPTNKSGKSFSDELISKTEKPAALERKPSISPIKPDDLPDDNNFDDISLPSLPARDQRSTVRSPLRKSISNAIHSSAVISFLTGRLDEIDPAAIPTIVVGNPFIKDALAKEDISAFLQTPMKLSQLLAGLDLNAALLQGSFTQEDLNSVVTPSEFLKSIGVDPQRVLTELNLLRSNLQVDGLTPYLQRAIAMQSQKPSAKRGTSDKSSSQQTQDSELNGQKATDPLTLAAMGGGAAGMSAAASMNSPDGAVSNEGADSLPIQKSAVEKTSSPGQGLSKNTSGGNSGSKAPSLNPKGLSAGQSSIDQPSVSFGKIPGDLSGVDPKPAISVDKKFTDVSIPAGNSVDILNPRNTANTSPSFETSTSALSIKGIPVKTSEFVMPRNSQPISFESASVDPYLAISQNNSFKDLYTFSPDPGEVSTSLSASAASTNPGEILSPQRILLDRFNKPIPQDVPISSGGQKAESILARPLDAVLTSENAASFDPRYFDSQRATSSQYSTISKEAQQIGPTSSPILASAIRNLDSSQFSSGGFMGHFPKNLSQQGLTLGELAGLDKGESRDDENEFSDSLPTTIDNPNNLKTATIDRAGQTADPFSISNHKPQIMKHLVDKASMLIKDGGGSVRIDLGSPELGRIDLAISVNHDKVSMKILTDSNKTREILGQDLEKLRETLSGQHLQLSKVELGTDDSSRRQSSFQNGFQWNQNFSHSSWNGDQRNPASNFFNGQQNQWNSSSESLFNQTKNFGVPTPIGRTRWSQIGLTPFKPLEVSRANGHIEVLA